MGTELNGDRFIYLCLCRAAAETEINKSVPVPTRMVVHSDPILLERITANLVSNAVRYTEHGKVLVGCRRRGDKVCLEVWDTGPGIEQDKIAEIFQDYYQLANPSRDPTRGLGLGLSIVERMAKLLEHKITVRSTLGKGSMFAIELPFVGRSQLERSVRPAQSHRHCRSWRGRRWTLGSTISLVALAKKSGPKRNDPKRARRAVDRGGRFADLGFAR